MSSKRILPYNSPGAERLRAASTSKRPKSTQSMASNGTQHQAIDSFIFEMEAKHPEAEEISIQGLCWMLRCISGCCQFALWLNTPDGSLMA